MPKHVFGIKECRNQGTLHGSAMAARTSRAQPQVRYVREDDAGRPARQPFPSFVEDACAILLQACKMRAKLQEPLLSELPGFSFVNRAELR